MYAYTICHKRRINKNDNRNDDVIADGDVLAETCPLENVHDNGAKEQDNTNECSGDADEQYQMTTEPIVNTADVEQNLHFENVPSTDNELIEQTERSSILENQTQTENENDNLNKNEDQNDSNKIDLTKHSTTTDNELTYDNNNSPTTLGNDILQKEWHRTLRSPIRARSSIQIITF